MEREAEKLDANSRLSGVSMGRNTIQDPDLNQGPSAHGVSNASVLAHNRMTTRGESEMTTSKLSRTGPNLMTKALLSVILMMCSAHPVHGQNCNSEDILGSDQTFSTGGFASAVRIGDINNDGIADIVTGNSRENNVGILAGAGGGVFQTPRFVGVGSGPSALALADFDGDGNLDIVTSNYGSNDVSILYGNGNLTFLPERVMSVGFRPIYVDVDDLNGDGAPDIVVLILGRGPHAASIFVNRGDGTFGDEMRIGTSGGSVSRGALVDINGDSALDLLTSNGSGGFAVFVGIGDGTFLQDRRFATDLFVGDVTAGDFDEDGIQDVALTISRPSNTFAILRGIGDGTFREPELTATQVHAQGRIDAADVNGDGHVDLIIGSAGGDTLILVGFGDGSFQRQEVFSTAIFRPSDMVVADLDADGLIDVITAGGGNPGTVSVRLGTCTRDPDGDGVPFPMDNCFDVANPSQADQDGDGVGDLCDDDIDGDGIDNDRDNCILIANPEQEDSDRNGIGDACPFGISGVPSPNPDSDPELPGASGSLCGAGGVGSLFSLSLMGVRLGCRRRRKGRYPGWLLAVARADGQD